MTKTTTWDALDPECTTVQSSCRRRTFVPPFFLLALVLNYSWVEPTSATAANAAAGGGGTASASLATSSSSTTARLIKGLRPRRRTITRNLLSHQNEPAAPATVFDSHNRDMQQPRPYYYTREIGTKTNNQSSKDSGSQKTKATKHYNQKKEKTSSKLGLVRLRKPKDGTTTLSKSPKQQTMVHKSPKQQTMISSSTLSSLMARPPGPVTAPSFQPLSQQQPQPQQYDGGSREDLYDSDGRTKFIFPGDDDDYEYDHREHTDDPRITTIVVVMPVPLPTQDEEHDKVNEEYSDTTDDEGTTITVIDSEGDEQENNDDNFEGTTITIIDSDNDGETGEGQGTSIVIIDPDDPIGIFDCRIAEEVDINTSINVDQDFESSSDISHVEKCHGNIPVRHFHQDNERGTWFKFKGTGEWIRTSVCPATRTAAEAPDLHIYQGDCADLICTKNVHSTNSQRCNAEWKSDLGENYYILVVSKSKTSSSDGSETVALRVEEVEAPSEDENDGFSILSEDENASPSRDDDSALVVVEECKNNATPAKIDGEVTGDFTFTIDDDSGLTPCTLGIPRRERREIDGAWLRVIGHNKRLRASSCPFRLSVYSGNCDDLMCTSGTFTSELMCEFEWTTRTKGTNYLLVQSTVAGESRSGPFTLRIDDLGKDSTPSQLPTITSTEPPPPPTPNSDPSQPPAPSPDTEKPTFSVETMTPTFEPTIEPTFGATAEPSYKPTLEPDLPAPSSIPTSMQAAPSRDTQNPTFAGEAMIPTYEQTFKPTFEATTTAEPTFKPTLGPVLPAPNSIPNPVPSQQPAPSRDTQNPTFSTETMIPTFVPTFGESLEPNFKPTLEPETTEFPTESQETDVPSIATSLPPVESPTADREPTLLPGSPIATTVSPAPTKIPIITPTLEAPTLVIITSAPTKDDDDGDDVLEQECSFNSIGMDPEEVITEMFLFPLSEDFEPCELEISPVSVRATWVSVSGTEGVLLAAESCPYQLSIYQNSCDDLQCIDATYTDERLCQAEWMSPNDGVSRILVQSTILGFPAASDETFTLAVNKVERTLQPSAVSSSQLPTITASPESFSPLPSSPPTLEATERPSLIPTAPLETMPPSKPSDEISTLPPTGEQVESAFPSSSPSNNVAPTESPTIVEPETRAPTFLPTSTASSTTTPTLAGTAMTRAPTTAESGIVPTTAPSMTETLLVPTIAPSASTTTITPIFVVPRNDDCPGSLPLNLGETIVASTQGATPEPRGLDTCFRREFNLTEIARPSIWYSLSVRATTLPATTGTQRLRLSACNNGTNAETAPVHLTLYESNNDGCDVLLCAPVINHLGCSLEFDVPSPLKRQVQFFYKLLVQQYISSSAPDDVGTFALTFEEATVPANDDCQEAQRLEIGSSFGATALSATPESPETVALCSRENGDFLERVEVKDPAPGVWYTLLAGGRVGVLASACDSARPDLIHVTVYSGSCNDLECLSDPDLSPACETLWEATSSESTYFILLERVLENGTDMGEYNLTVDILYR